MERVLNKRATVPDQGYSSHDSKQRDPSSAQVSESEQRTGGYSLLVGEQPTVQEQHGKYPNEKH